MYPEKVQELGTRTVRTGTEGTAEQREQTGFFLPQNSYFFFLNRKFLLTDKDRAFSYSIKG